jgi:hypothetical protein
LEARLYNERHTKAVLDEERRHIAKKLADIKNVN